MKRRNGAQKGAPGRSLAMRWIAASLVAMPLAAWAQYAIDGQVVANGGTSHASGGEYTLEGTLAEPLAGPVSAGSLTFDAGFWQPQRAAPADELFRHGFED